jgi:hypothetical protein
MAFKIINRSLCNLKLSLYSKVPLILFDFAFKESLALFEFIYYRSRKSGFCDINGYVLCHSVVLKKLFGNNYSYGIDELLSLNLIEPKWYYDENGKQFKYSEDKGIACSYRITSSAADLLEKKQFQYVQKDYTYKIPRKKNGKIKLQTEYNDLKNLKLVDNYQGITIDPNWIDLFKNPMYFPPNHYKYPSEPIARTGFFFHSKGLIESILKKSINIKTDSECGRAFHPIIEMSKILRPYIRINGEKLVNIDAKSFHPHLIASFITDKIQREKYLGILKRGFYEEFVDKNHSRDKIKVLLQKWLSGRPTKDPKVLEIGRWYEDNFPDVALKMKELKKRKTTFQMCLQQIESSIFVAEVFMKADFWCLPMHDGLCVLQKDVDAACEFIGRACESRLGYRIPLESH